MPFRRSSDDSEINSRQVHLNSSVISVENKRRHHHMNSEDYLNPTYRQSVISKAKRDERLYNDESNKQYHSSYKPFKVETYREPYKEEEVTYKSQKRSKLTPELIDKEIKKSDRSSHKNKDQSNKRENRKHKKTRDHKDKSKRDKYQSKSKKDNKRRKSNNEDEPDSKRSNQPFAYNNDYVNNDSDVNNDDRPNQDYSLLEPNPVDENHNSPRNSVSSIIKKNLDDFLQMGMLEKEEYNYSAENDDDPQTKEYYDEELVHSDDFGHDYYHSYPVRSKFESLTSDDSEIEDLRNNEHSYERDSRSVSTESSSSESFGSSISSSRNPKKKQNKADNADPQKYRSEYEDKLIFSPVKEPESEEEIDNRPLYYPAVQGCRLVEEFECLNKIEEGTYGVVFRARDRKTNEIVALKRLKMEKERDGFPITSLREINTLMKAQHENIVTVREVVVGSNMDKIYLVMDFIEHDLKSLMISMVKPFEICEVKCLMLQLLSAVAHLHDNWILHRDLKTSNLLLSHKGVLKVADFGLAREYGSPLKNYTRVVVTLWYRAPELLLGTKVYSTQIDLWSVGCIFGELLLMMPLFPGKSEADQINILFKELGTPSEKIWPGVSNLPNIKRFEFGKFEYNRLGKKFNLTLSECGLELINRFLAYCPERRITAEEALNHSYFNESPKAISSEMFPTRPAKSEGGVISRSRLIASPKPPSGGQGVNKLNDDKILGLDNLYNRRG